MAHDQTAARPRVFVGRSRTARPRGRHVGAEPVLDHAPRPSVDEAIDDFLAAVDARAVRDRRGHVVASRAGRELHWYLGGYVREAFGPLGADDVRRCDVEALLYDLHGRGLSRLRLRALATSVRALYDYALEHDLAERNPAERVAVPIDEESPGAAGDRADAARHASPDRIASIAMRLGTLGFLLLALTFLAESL
jgi:site-specific recombinase XerC